ncbi:MAG TPA: GntR family transcriptional regulator [Gammaproteobacteria bacterium]|nr:GntR family transcriptional regulator [Gammaproteobacteria bacterium]
MTEAIALFHISPSAGAPIYRQLMDQIERMLAAGELRAGDELPSVRQLAARLEINPMTVSKAYSLLEGGGRLQRLRGRGMVVPGRFEEPRSEAARLRLLEPALDELVAQARELKLPAAAVVELLSKRLEKKRERTGT